MDAPDGLFKGGTALWQAITDEHELSAAQVVQLTEACRAKDRLDVLDGMLREGVESQVLKDANATANLMKQLIAALRLPDPVTGKTPQFRGPRGAQKPTVAGGKVSSLDRARARASAG